MLPQLTEGALDRITNGEEIQDPVLQILGHKKLDSKSNGERYRLLVSDGVKSNSFTMLATQLNDLIHDNTLSEHTIVCIKRYAISSVNNSGTQKRVMVILNIEVLVPGQEVGTVIGNPMSNTKSTEDSKPASTTSAPRPVMNQPVESKKPKYGNNPLNESLSGGGGIMTTPIAALSPYQNKWVIKARVTNKSPIRTWSNSRGEGKLFSLDLLDESGEIRCTAFRDQCDKFYDLIEIGKVYYISRCTLKPANKSFNHLKNDYEMTFNNDSEVAGCNEEAEDIPQLQFSFENLKVIESKPKDDLIDVLGIVKSCTEAVTITAKSSGRELLKRDVNIVDENNDMVTVTLWGNQANDFDGSNNPVIAIKGAKVGEFNGGKSLSLVGSSMLQINPDIPEAHKLRGWYKNVGINEESRSLSRTAGGGGGMNGPWVTFQEAEEQRFGHSDMPNQFIVKATVNIIKAENAIYKSCPSDNCKKKVIDQNNGMYKCEKCAREYPNFNYRLLASANLVDWSGNQWATAFSEEAEKMLGATAQELGELQERDHEAYLEKIGAAAFKSYIFKLRLRMENYNDENRLKANVVAIQPIDYKAYHEKLLSKIKELADIKN